MQLKKLKEMTDTALEIAIQKNIAKKSQEIRSEIIISVGSGQNKIYLTCDSWQTGTHLLEQAMTQLDSIPIGL